MRIALHDNDLETWVEKSTSGVITVHFWFQASFDDVLKLDLGLSHNETQNLISLWSSEGLVRKYERLPGLVIISAEN